MSLINNYHNYLTQQVKLFKMLAKHFTVTNCLQNWEISLHIKSVNVGRQERHSTIKCFVHPKSQPQDIICAEKHTIIKFAQTDLLVVAKYISNAE